MYSHAQPLLDLPELVIERIAQLSANEDRPQLMATSRKVAKLCMGCSGLRLCVDDGVAWMRLKQVLHWAKGLRHLKIETSKAYKPLTELTEQADQQGLAACNVLLGPAYESYVQRLSFPGVQTVTIKAKGLPCIVPHFIAAVCPNLTSLVYQPLADTDAETFVQTTSESLPIPLCINLRHIECHGVWLVRGYHSSQDLKRQLPNITSLKLRGLTPKWLNSWSHQLTHLHVEQYCQDRSWFAARIDTVQPAQQLQRLTITDWDGQLPIHVIAPALTSLELPGHDITQVNMQQILELTQLQSLTATHLYERGISSDFSLQAIAPTLRTLVLSKVILSDSKLCFISKLTNLQSLEVTAVTTGKSTLHAMAPNLQSLVLAGQNLSESVMHCVMQLTNLRRLAVCDFSKGNFGTDFSQQECGWERFEVISCTQIFFEQLARLPLQNIKEIVLDQQKYDKLDIHLPDPSDPIKVAAVRQTCGYLLESMELKLNANDTRSVQWHIHDHSHGVDAATMFSAAAAVFKALPTLNLRNFKRGSACLSAVVDWASTTSWQAVVDYDALLEPGFTEILQRLPYLSVIFIVLSKGAKQNCWSSDVKCECSMHKYFRTASFDAVNMATTHLVAHARRPVTLKFLPPYTDWDTKNQDQLRATVRLGDVEWQMALSCGDLWWTASMVGADACDGPCI